MTARKCKTLAVKGFSGPPVLIKKMGMQFGMHDATSGIMHDNIAGDTAKLQLNDHESQKACRAKANTLINGDIRLSVVVRASGKMAV